MDARVRKALDRIRRRARWLVRPPRVSGRLPPMTPGAERLGEREAEAAAEAAREVVGSKRLYRYATGPLERSYAGRLERAFARRIDAEEAVAVNSGTSALLCALAGLGIGPGDEVVVPAYTWVSTASAVLAVGAVPIFAEVDESLTLDPARLEERLSPQTRAIVAVHMRGAPARLDELARLASRRELALIEDAAQALGGSYRGRPLGGIGDAGAFSFGQHKAITAGEGGMLVSSDPELLGRARMFSDAAAPAHLGVEAGDWLTGINLRLSELQAAVLAVQLDRLDGLIAAMRERRRRLRDAVADELGRAGFTLRAETDAEGDAGLALIAFAPEASVAAATVAALVEQNVPASRLYKELSELPRDFVDLHAYPAWAPIHQRRSFSHGGAPWRGHPREVSYGLDDCPRTVELLGRAVHIDVSPDLSLEQVDQIAAAVLEVSRSLGRA